MTAVPPGFEAEPQDAREVISAEVEDIAAAWPGDPLPRYTALSARQAHYQAVSEGLAEARAACVYEMHEDGASYARIAELAGLTRARARRAAGRHRRIRRDGPACPSPAVTDPVPGPVPPWCRAWAVIGPRRYWGDVMCRLIRYHAAQAGITPVQLRAAAYARAGDRARRLYDEYVTPERLGS